MYPMETIFYTTRNILKVCLRVSAKMMFFEQKSFSYVVIFYFKEETVLFYNKQNKS